uniref:G_PROTEIN_RECEP_F1_2 domain-containing protein n=1 Tax=Macrostomum lignano TaxID=282301 RepID=A0A1I8GWS5_9PLAT
CQQQRQQCFQASSTTESATAAAADSDAAATAASLGLQIPALPLGARVLIIVILAACGLVCLLGNAVTCHVILHSRRLQSTTNYFRLSDGLHSDAGMALVSLAGLSWPLGDPACRLAGVLLHSHLGCNVCLLLSIQADRYYAIVRPLSSRISRSVAKRLIFASCSIGVASAAPMAALYSQRPVLPGGGRFVCAPGGQTGLALAYICPYSALAFLLPTCATLALFVRVWTYLWTINQPRGSLRGGRMLQRTANQVPRAKVKTFKLMATVALTDLTAMSLAQVLVLVFVGIAGAATALATLETTDRPLGFDPFVLSVSLYSLAGLSKPVLYACMNANFRRGCREVLCWSKRRVYRQELYTVTSVSVFSKRNYVTAVDISGAVANRWENPSMFEVTSSAKASPIGGHGNAI